VAGALRNGSRSVDAVEIDPAILELGKREHPEHPYDSPRVSIHVTDARSFLKRSPRKYDLILFGLLDSHSQFTDYANMRIDNFVYTEQSFREAREHLGPNGVVVLKFQVGHPWLAVRMAEMLHHTFGMARSSFSMSRTTQLRRHALSSLWESGGAGRGCRSATERFVREHAVRLQDTPVPVTTDDWPYLYQEAAGFRVRTTQSECWSSLSRLDSICRLAKLVAGRRYSFSAWVPDFCCWKRRSSAGWLCSLAQSGR